MTASIDATDKRSTTGLELTAGRVIQGRTSSVSTLIKGSCCSLCKLQNGIKLSSVASAQQLKPHDNLTWPTKISSCLVQQLHFPVLSLGVQQRWKRLPASALPTQSTHCKASSRMKLTMLEERLRLVLERISKACKRAAVTSALRVCTLRTNLSGKSNKCLLFPTV